MTDSPSPLRRSTTLPTRVAPRRTRHSLGAYDLPNGRPELSDEILYYHPSAKIVKFELPNSSSSEPILPDLDYPVDAVETLPWKVSTERIASLGALKIEKIAGSTTFLKSGSVVYALLKNCQCWCVDNKSIFVLRIRKLTYYRIELPFESEDDISSVENLKVALSKIIRYEITPCPFQRGFSVELPEEARTPKKKVAWRPKAESVSEPIPWNLVVGKSDIEPTVQESVEDGEGNASDVGGSVRGFSPIAPAKRPSSSPAPFPTITERRIVSEPVQTFQSLVERFEDSDADQAAEDIQSSRAGQSAAALQCHEDSGDKVVLEACSRVSSFDSYHSCNSAVPSIEVSPSSPRPESPSAAQSFSSDVDESQIDTPQQHSRNVSETTVSPDIPEAETVDHFTSQQELPGSKDSFLATLHITTDDAISCTSSDEGYASKSTATVEDPNPTVRQRLRVSRKREHSPMPPPSTLIIPAPKSPAHHLRDSILQKTFTYVLGPPTQFLLIILRLAARVATQNNNSTPNTPDQGNRSSSRDSLSEDDFGMPLTRATSNSTKYNRFTEQTNGSPSDKLD